jgi:hypothetical protein
LGTGLQVLSHARANGNEFNDAFLRRQSAPLSGLILAEAYGANYPLDSENFTTHFQWNCAQLLENLVCLG